MNKQRVPTEELHIVKPDKEPSSISFRDDVVVVINQAYGPGGDKLVGVSDVTFDGFPAITLWVRAGESEGYVHLSPIHGDHRKAGLSLPRGTVCELCCPVSKRALAGVDTQGREVAPDSVSTGDKPSASAPSEHCMIYLDAELTPSSAVFLSRVWDNYASRVIDNDELVSAYMND